MSSLQFGEKKLFEKIFGMEGGYLLDFSNARLQEFLNDYEIDLGNNKYDKYGSSKAKRFRAFWEIEPDEVVAPILKGLLDYATLHSNILPKDAEGALKIIERLEQKENIGKSKLSSGVEKNIIEKRIWGTGKIRVFLSHKSEYKNETANLKEELSKHNITCFVAHEDVEPTREWQSEIENALFSMDVLVALMTEGFQNSRWTDQEIGIALGRGKRVISVNLGTAPYGFVGKVQALSSSWENLEKDILEILNRL
jgi:hypothetical protein